MNPLSKEYKVMREIIKKVQEYEKLMQNTISHEHYRNLENMMEQEVYNIIVDYKNSLQQQ
jgi:hypothetical protein